MLKKIKVKIEGIHCQSCKILIEGDIAVLPGVKKIEVDYLKNQADLEFENEKITQKEIFRAIENLNYKPIVIQKDNSVGMSGSFYIGLILPIVIVFFVMIYLLFIKYNGFEILSVLNENNIGYSIIFLIGLLASFHCIGMCGGLVIAYSTISSKKETKQSILPHWQYNFGRLISYTLIGGILGGIGKFFGINPVFTGLVMLIAGCLMILMGLSFITKWKILEKIKIKTPVFIARYIFNQKHTNKPKGPLIIGLLNGFMPCGPLQAMQLYALAAGSFYKGALSMGIYALGTIPLMFIFGIFIYKISNRFIIKIIKISGILVIILGIIMINRGLTNLGNSVIPIKSNDSNVSETQNGFQEVEMVLDYFGYEPNVLYIKKGIPVRWIINVKQMSGCTNAIRIDDYNISQDLQLGENIIEFTPDKIGELKFSCWMKMVWGKFIVTQ